MARCHSGYQTALNLLLPKRFIPYTACHVVQTESQRNSMKIVSVFLFFCMTTGCLTSELQVTEPPTEVRQRLALSPFYKQYINADGLAIVGSERVSSQALLEAAWIVNHMLAGRDDIRQAIVKQKVRLAVMAATEFTTDIPEHSDLKPPEYWNKRARGLGATAARPAVSCAAENLLCYKGDPYHGESVGLSSDGTVNRPEENNPNTNAPYPTPIDWGNR